MTGTAQAAAPQTTTLRVAFDSPRKGFRHARIVGKWPPEFHRERGPQLVLAPDKGPGPRLKAWGHGLDRSWTINGETVAFALRKTGSPQSRYEAVLDPAVSRRIVNAAPGADASGDDWTPEQGREEREARIQAAVKRQKERERKRLAQRSRSQAQRIALAVERAGPGEPIDACVETVFRPDPRSEHLAWRGSTAGWPEWMDARAITITPPRTGGGHHCLDLHAPGVRHDRAPMIRVNGVWCWCCPVGGQAGHHWLTCDPEDMHEIRAYGEDLAAEDIELANEPVPPRTQTAVRALHLLLTCGDRYGPGMDHDMYRGWMADVREIERALIGMTGAQGQVDVYRSMQDRCASEVVRLERLCRSRYGRRPAAYRDYAFSAWVSEVGASDKKVSGWMYNAGENSKGEATARGRADRLDARVAEQREKYDAAITRCLQREAEYADAIDILYRA